MIKTKKLKSCKEALDLIDKLSNKKLSILKKRRIKLNSYKEGKAYCFIVSWKRKP